MIEITEQNVGRIVKRSNKPVIVIFAGEWCPDCNALTPLYQRLEEKYEEELVFGRAHVGKEKEGWPEKFNFEDIPTFIIFKDGKVWKKLQDEEDIGHVEEAIQDLPAY